MQDYGIDWDLPKIVTEAKLASELVVKANGLGRMAREGTVPLPTARDGHKGIWLETDLIDWFSTVQPSQAAYASIDPDLGQKELLNQGVYVCPSLDYRFIGQRRPTMLALYESKQPKNTNGNSIVQVYDVEFVQTQAGVMGETMAWPAGQPQPQGIPWNTIRPGDGTLHTVFKLKLETARVLEIGRAWQRGGTISTASLHQALSTGFSSHFSGGLAQ